MWIAIAVVMLMALLGRRDAEYPWEGLHTWSDDLTVYRSSDDPLAFPRLGLSVTPSKGWSCLMTTDAIGETRPTFVHAGSQLIARLSRFRGFSWPPTFPAAVPESMDDLAAIGGDEPAAASPTPGSKDWRPKTQRTVRESAARTLDVDVRPYDRVEVHWVHFEDQAFRTNYRGDAGWAKWRRPFRISSVVSPSSHRRFRST
jgi:hypothetical protein